MRRKKAWFENLFIWGFGGTLGVWSVMMYYRPEPEIEAWARQEVCRSFHGVGDCVGTSLENVCMFSIDVYYD
jgi:hypothetical protein